MTRQTIFYEKVKSRHTLRNSTSTWNILHYGFCVEIGVYHPAKHHFMTKWSYVLLDSIPQLWTSTSKWNILKIGFFVEICVFHHDKLQFRIGNMLWILVLYTWVWVWRYDRSGSQICFRTQNFIFFKKQNDPQMTTKWPSMTPTDSPMNTQRTPNDYQWQSVGTFLVPRCCKMKFYI